MARGRRLCAATRSYGRPHSVSRTARAVRPSGRRSCRRTNQYAYGIVPAIAANLPVQAISALSNNPRIAIIEPDGIATITDAELDNTWGVKRIGAGTAHDAVPSLRGTAVRVAVIDTGIMYTHADLAANYKGGWDFVNNDPDPMDDHGHGTHVAGTIAAAKDNAGVVGVAPEAFLYGVKVLGEWQRIVSAIIAGVDWLRQQHAGHEQQLRGQRVQRDDGAGVCERGGRRRGECRVGGKRRVVRGYWRFDWVSGKILVGHRRRGDRRDRHACVFFQHGT